MEQTSEARSALKALLRESKFISFHTAVERGGKITMDQAVAVVKVRFCVPSKARWMWADTNTTRTLEDHHAA